MLIRLISTTVLSALFFIRKSLARTSYPEGSFCVWTEPKFKGHRAVFSGNDEQWENDINAPDGKIGRDAAMNDRGASHMLKNANISFNSILYH
ncbi:hypothetical protein BJ944DRAFT_237567 [Cunninghamella echinulata]|nr:hypothetical protein BJ944DRAFT_237567 [Cunninghamella echinulata]